MIATLKIRFLPVPRQQVSETDIILNNCVPRTWHNACMDYNNTITNLKFSESIETFYKFNTTTITILQRTNET